MGKDRRKIEQKKALKAARIKAKKAEHKKHPAGQGDVPMGMRSALEAPISQCWEPVQLFHQNNGIGTVIITRKTPQHRIVLGSFLLDVFCLGVKDAFLRVITEIEYQGFLEKAKQHQTLKKTTPERARKLIEAAEAYARSIGFEPHKDYQSAKKIFGDINPEQCPDTFAFGQNGKPVYIAGPYDDRRFRDRVMRTLTEKLSADGFHYLMPVGDDIPGDFFEVEEPEG